MLKKLYEIQDDTVRQCNKVRKTIHYMKDKFSKEIEIIKKEQNRNHGAAELNK
jgi:hypothetical protein